MLDTPRFVVFLVTLWDLAFVDWNGNRNELDIVMVFPIIFSFSFFRFCIKRGYWPGFSMRIKKNQKGSAFSV
jgi:hypothetical protein